MSAAGLEPATNGLKGHCSAIELRAHCGGNFITLNSHRQRVNPINGGKAEAVFL